MVDDLTKIKNRRHVRLFGYLSISSVSLRCNLWASKNKNRQIIPKIAIHQLAKDPRSWSFPLILFFLSSDLRPTWPMFSPMLRRNGHFLIVLEMKILKNVLSLSWTIKIWKNNNCGSVFVGSGTSTISKFKSKDMEKSPTTFGVSFAGGSEGEGIFWWEFL